MKNKDEILQEIDKGTPYGEICRMFDISYWDIEKIQQEKENGKDTASERNN